MNKNLKQTDEYKYAQRTQAQLDYIRQFLAMLKEYEMNKEIPVLSKNPTRSELIAYEDARIAWSYANWDISEKSTVRQLRRMKRRQWWFKRPMLRTFLVALSSSMTFAVGGSALVIWMHW